MTLSQRIRGKPDSAEELFFRKVLSAQVRAGARSIPLLEGRSVRLGREASNDLPIEGESIDGQHAQIKLERSRIWVRDLSSKHGTRVNGHRLKPREWTPLRSSDQLSLAKQDISLELELEPLQPGLVATPASDHRPTAASDAAGRQADWNPALLKVGLAVTVALLLLLVGKACTSKPAPKPGQNQKFLSWRLFGTVQLKKGDQTATLIITVPEVPTVVKKSFTVDAQGRYEYDFDLKVKADKVPTRLEVEWQQDGRILGADRNLKLPPPGDSLQLPPLGVGSPQRSRGDP